MSDASLTCPVIMRHRTLLQVTTFVEESFGQIKIFKLETKFAFFALINNIIFKEFLKGKLNQTKFNQTYQRIIMDRRPCKSVRYFGLNSSVLSV